MLEKTVEPVMLPGVSLTTVQFLPPSVQLNAEELCAYAIVGGFNDKAM